MMRRIYWLASYPKSGNTWVRLMLDGYVRGVVDINWPTEIVNSDTQVYAHRVVAPRSLTDMEPGEIRHLRHAALMHLIERHPTNPVVLKTHNANIRATTVDLIPKEMTEGAIYLVRDPRDVVISYAEHVGHESIEEAMENMANTGTSLDNGKCGIYHYLTTWSIHVQSWTQTEEFPVTVIRYEDMLEDPARELTRILEGLDMEPDPERVQRAVDASRFDAVKGQEDEKGFREASKKTDRFFKRGTAGHWRDILTDEQVAQIEAAHAPWMEKMGYKLAMLRPDEVAAEEEA